MTSILVKSFNRPYYLDRCLQSIFTFVKGDFIVTVMDDGTPEKHIAKLQKKYPQVKFVFSDQVEEKRKAIAKNIEAGTPINGFQIPISLWKSEVSKSFDYVLVTEDDVWFTEELFLSEIVNTCKEKNISLLKLGWLGNKKDDIFLEINELNKSIESTIPKGLLLFNETLMDLFFYNKYKFFTILYKLKKVDNRTKRKYWALNSILMGLYEKEYWLAIWKNLDQKVDEKRQLRDAANYYKKHQHPNFVARLKKEVMKTTFQSSSTNSYHEYGYNFDVNYFNHLINEAWYNDQFNSQENFPKDFSLDYLASFLDEKINKEEMKKWVKQFQQQYANLGCKVN